MVGYQIKVRARRGAGLLINECKDALVLILDVVSASMESLLTN